MSTKATGNKKHLTLADRAAIEHGISCGENFTADCRRINKDSSTISKEIRASPFPGSSFFKTKPSGNARNVSIIRTVKKQHICGNQTCNSLCWKCRPSAAPCIVLTLLPDSAKS